MKKAKISSKQGSKHNASRTQATGKDYPETNYKNPWNAGIDETYGSADDKTILSPTATVEGPRGVPVRNDYDELWEDGK